MLPEEPVFISGVPVFFRQYAYAFGVFAESQLTESMVQWYIGNNMKTHVVERVQTGVRIEKRLLKVLKALAEDRDMSLGDLLEGIVLHVFDGKCPFQPETVARIGELKRFYGLDLDAAASHKLVEANGTRTTKKEKRR